MSAAAALFLQAARSKYAVYPVHSHFQAPLHGNLNALVGQKSPMMLLLQFKPLSTILWQQYFQSSAFALSVLIVSLHLQHHLFCALY